jgi:hypothetical protein
LLDYCIQDRVPVITISRLSPTLVLSFRRMPCSRRKLGVFQNVIGLMSAKIHVNWREGYSRSSLSVTESDSPAKYFSKASLNS